MKYIILSTGAEQEVVVGDVDHYALAEGKMGMVISAGHYEVADNGDVTVYGGSYWYNIQSDPVDAEKIKAYLKKIAK